VVQRALQEGVRFVTFDTVGEAATHSTALLRVKLSARTKHFCFAKNLTFESVNDTPEARTYMLGWPGGT